ncbi:MAG TPA: hypothetical protein PL187_18425 [Caldilinea sp.]|nr:hypothetical protein [Caldilinea sp.]
MIFTSDRIQTGQSDDIAIIVAMVWGAGCTESLPAHTSLQQTAQPATGADMRGLHDRRPADRRRVCRGAVYSPAADSALSYVGLRVL